MWCCASLENVPSGSYHTCVATGAHTHTLKTDVTTLRNQQTKKIAKHFLIQIFATLLHVHVIYYPTAERTTS